MNSLYAKQERDLTQILRNAYLVQQIAIVSHAQMPMNALIVSGGLLVL